MKIYRFQDLSREAIRELCRRNPVAEPPLLETCRKIFQDVADRGDRALREYTLQFDGVELTDFRVRAADFSAARKMLAKETLAALETAARNIRKFHAQQQRSEEPVEVQPGITCWRASRAIASVGLYVPGGTTVLPSTVLMLGIPARLAGCPKILLCVPPRRDGSVGPEVLAAAQIAGIRQVFRIGGIQAVAAMALGTESVPRVDKILGPGNRYVQAAKLTATLHGVAIDMVAGPSEVLVIADGEASAELVASDLLSQAEHSSDSRAILVTNSAALAEQVERELKEQLKDLPRKKMASEALSQSFAMVTSSLEEAFDFSNCYAPEHLILHLEDARDWVGRIQSAGSVFLGPWAPEVAGDYASGTNHALPTSGQARAVSGVSVDSFVKKITFQELTPQGLQNLAPVLETLAGMESLEGHRRAVRLRLEKLAAVGTPTEES